MKLNAKMCRKAQLAGTALIFLFGVWFTQGQIIPKQQNPFPDQLPAGAPGCSLQKSCAELAPGMIQSALGASPLEANLRHLTTKIGGRITGSAANAKALAWAVAAFRAAGVSDVKTESFTLPVSWSEGATAAEVVSPRKFVLRLVSTGWSPPIFPRAGITARVVDAGDGDEAGFAAAADSARDSIVFVHQAPLNSVDDLLAEYTRARPGDLLDVHATWRFALPSHRNAGRGSVGKNPASDRSARRRRKARQAFGEQRIRARAFCDAQ